MKAARMASVALALAAGLPLKMLGHFRHEKPLKRAKRPVTQSDHDALAAAQAKRERKAEKLRGQGL